MRENTIDSNLGEFKFKFLSEQKNNDLLLNSLSSVEVAEYISKISGFSKEEKIKFFQELLNDRNGKNNLNPTDIAKQQAKLILLLKSIPFEKSEADIYWKNKAKVGIHEDTKKVLIEIAAMHPLIDGKPGKEFLDHLNQGLDLYNIELQKGNSPIFYIPGSKHCILDKTTGKTLVDSKPLSEAGKEFLINHGIPETSIRAEATNIKIKKDDGVYNSGDECYVAAQIAKEENCGRIISVVSPDKLYRNALFYQEFGYNPELYAIGTENTEHNYIGEIFWSLYITYMLDQDWQTSFLAYLTRKERDINFSKKSAEYSDAIDTILKNGPGISQEVFDKKKEWLDLYHKAQKNMDCANQSNNNILINLIRTEDQQKLEQRRILQLINQYPESKFTLLYDSSYDVFDIQELVKKQNIVNISFLSVNSINASIITNEFNNGNYKKLFGMYPSSICIKQAVELIKNGIIPMVSALPDKNPNYINSISEVFDEVMNI